MGVSVEISGKAAVVTLRWPERRNSLGPADVDPVADAILDATARDVRAVVLTGDGAFCAGGDLAGFGALARDHGREVIRDTVYAHVHRMVHALWDSPVPTIAAVDGPAVGLGMDLALACDTAFVGAKGWMQQGWARAGLIPGTGGGAMLQALNPAAPWRLLADQPRLDAAACAELGLAEPPVDDALAAALARTAKLASIPADVVRAYVQLLRPGRVPSEHHLEQCADLQAGFIGSDRFRELAASVTGGR